MVNNLETMEVLKGSTNVEATTLATKVIGVLGGNFVVDDNWTANEANRCGIKVEGVIEIFPGRDGMHYGDWQRRLKVSSICGSSLSQRELGKLASILARMMKKWALKVRIALLVALE